jgi:hypothetical protein
VDHEFLDEGTEYLAPGPYSLRNRVSEAQIVETEFSQKEYLKIPGSLASTIGIAISFITLVA